MRGSNNIHPSVWVLLLMVVGLAVFATGFVWQDTLGGFENDAVSYVILAQWMSPYHSVPEVISAAAAFEKYPPVFPLLLALTGASHNMLLAHLVVSSLFLVAVVLTYFLAVAILKDRWPALLVAMLFAACPSAWLNMSGILSENLYLVISLAGLLVLEKMDSGQAPLSSSDAVMLTALFSLLVMTRSIGVAIAGAYFCWLLFRFRSVRPVLSWRHLAPVFVSAGLALAWGYLRETSGADLYASDVAQSVSRMDLIPQLGVMYKNWLRAFILYWSASIQLNQVIVSIFGIFTIVGIAWRIRQNKVDGWYAAIYLGILLIWPYPGQFSRFLHGILPLLIIHATCGLYFSAGKISSSAQLKAVSGALVVILLMVLPTLTFFYFRAEYQTPYKDMDFTNVSQFYGEADLSKAAFRALRNEQLRLEIDLVGDSTPEEARIMWFTPNYLRLLAHRSAVAFPDFSDNTAFIQGIRDSGADHILVTNLNPRFTRETYNGLTAVPQVQPVADLVWESRFPGSNEVSARLFRVNTERLDRVLEDLARDSENP